MASDRRRRATETTVFPKNSLHANGSWGANWPASDPPAPWSKLSWGLFLPLVFAGNIAVTVLAWFIAELVTR